MLIKIAAAALLAALLWALLRFALGLRWAKESREAARRAEEQRGRRVVAELPLESGAVELLLEDDRLFLWGARSVAKAAIRGARLQLNGGVLAECSRPGAVLPRPAPPAEFDGSERWEVVLHLEGQGPVTIPCGRLREGVSREIAHAAYEAVGAVVGAPQ
jgi:hypothetical protein